MRLHSIIEHATYLFDPLERARFDGREIPMAYRSRLLNCLLSGVAAPALLLVSAPAIAQTAPAPGDQARNPNTASNDPVAENEERIGDIIVTAQRREQNLQDVPITVSAITAEAARASGVSQTSDLPQLVAGVTFNRVTANPLLFIRGIGTQNTQTGEEGANPVYVDGFYNPSLPGALFSFNNIERIEVLKGPQGTLLGRNSMGGAINVITRDPSHTTSVLGSVGYGNYDTIEGNLYATTGLADNAAGDISLYHHSQDGYGTNLVSGKDVNDRDEFAARVKVLVTGGDRTKLTFAADYVKSEFTQGFSIHPEPGAFTPINLETYPGNYQDVRMNFQPKGFVKQRGLQLRGEHAFDFARFVSMTGYREVLTDFDYDQDVSSVAIVDARLTGDVRFVTQEFQLLSPQGSKIEWIIGGFYLSSEARSIQFLSGLGLAAAGGLLIPDADISTESFAGYAEATFPVLDALDITAGVRYTQDTKRLTFLNKLPNLNIIQRREDENDWGALTWRLAASYHVNDDIMLYASASRGFKSGTYNPSSFANPVASPEKLTALEFGFRSDLFDRRLRLNASLFDYDYRDIQVLQAQSGTSLLVNAAQARVRGLDLEMVARPVKGLQFSSGASFLFKHEYTSFPNAPASRQRPVPPGGNTTFVADATGNTMIQSPDFTGYVNAIYTVPLSSGDISFTANYSYTSKIFWEADNRLRSPGYGLLNGQIAWTLPDTRYTVRVWGRNLADKEYAYYKKSSVADGAAPAPPRTYGVALDVRF
jgi:iron complex outermembrane receptor protein